MGTLINSFNTLSILDIWLTHYATKYVHWIKSRVRLNQNTDIYISQKVFENFVKPFYSSIHVLNGLEYFQGEISPVRFITKHCDAICDKSFQIISVAKFVIAFPLEGPTPGVHCGEI